MTWVVSSSIRAASDRVERPRGRVAATASRRVHARRGRRAAVDAAPEDAFAAHVLPGDQINFQEPVTPVPNAAPTWEEPPTPVLDAPAFASATPHRETFMDALPRRDLDAALDEAPGQGTWYDETYSDLSPLQDDRDAINAAADRAVAAAEALLARADALEHEHADTIASLNARIRALERALSASEGAARVGARGGRRGRVESSAARAGRVLRDGMLPSTQHRLGKRVDGTARIPPERHQRSLRSSGAVLACNS